jgi:hypothetical protein
VAGLEQMDPETVHAIDEAGADGGRQQAGGEGIETGHDPRPLPRPGGGTQVVPSAGAPS